MPTTFRKDWQGYEIDVPREQQCRRRCPGTRTFCDRAEGSHRQPQGRCKPVGQRERGGGCVMPRAMTKHERAAALRPRVLDAIHDMGHGDPQKGIERFVDHALWCAERAELRTWKAISRDAQRRACAYSLRTLLHMHDRTYEGWDVSQAANVHWVLDVWEAACDDWFRVAPVTVESADDVIREMAEWGDTSPDAVASLVGVPTQKLSTRILDAYVNRDSDRMLELLAEMEGAGL